MNTALEFLASVVSGVTTYLLLCWLAPNLMRGLGLADDDDDAPSP